MSACDDIANSREEAENLSLDLLVDAAAKLGIHVRVEVGEPDGALT